MTCENTPVEVFNEVDGTVTRFESLAKLESMSPEHAEALIDASTEDAS